MSSKRVTEAELRQRLLEAGKTGEEVEQMIDQYLEVSRSEVPDEEAISRILQSTHDDSVLRVRGFKLAKEQYETLLGYYEESGKLVPGQQVDANFLVQKALEEFTALLL
jgi:hypothetical protein